MAQGENPPSGVGGWLALFLFSLCGFLIDALISIVSSSSGSWWRILRPLDADALHQLATAVLCGLAVARFLCVRNWRTVRLGIVILWLLPALQLAHDVVAWWHWTGELRAPGAGIVLFCAYSVVWTTYLLRSVRVANTYARDAKGDALAQVFE